MLSVTSEQNTCYYEQNACYYIVNNKYVPVYAFQQQGLLGLLDV